MRLFLATLMGIAALCTSIMLSAASEGSGDASLSANKYGYSARRPIMGAACPTCVWGPFAAVTKEIMASYGWDIQICWNCNEADSPRYVADGRVPHDLTPREVAIGDPPPPKGAVDFGVTNQRLLQWAYDGTNDYKEDGPKHQLRLIAAFEDPTFLLVAATKRSGVTDLAQIREKKLPVQILVNPKDVLLVPILKFYGIGAEQLESWGGKIVTGEEARNETPDVVINRSASTAQNLESQYWTKLSQSTDLNYIALAPQLRDSLVKNQGFRPVTLPIGYLRGVKEPIPTLELSGQAVYGRADMPEEFAYTLAKAMDEHRTAYLWAIRPFILDPRKVAKVGDVPLHPGAARYYREVGYIN